MWHEGFRGFDHKAAQRALKLQKTKLCLMVNIYIYIQILSLPETITIMPKANSSPPNAGYHGSAKTTIPKPTFPTHADE
jgi:hypothetical protein